MERNKNRKQSCQGKSLFYVWAYFKKPPCVNNPHHQKRACVCRPGINIHRRESGNSGAVNSASSSALLALLSPPPPPGAPSRPAAHIPGGGAAAAGGAAITQTAGGIPLPETAACATSLGTMGGSAVGRSRVSRERVAGASV